MKNDHIRYNAKLKQSACELRKNSTLSEVLLWRQLKGRKMLGYDFHRQKPIDRFIVDFYCSELLLAIEIDGSTHLDYIGCDKSRQGKLESYGIKFLRFADKDVKYNLEGVLDTIRTWIQENTVFLKP